MHTGVRVCVWVCKRWCVTCMSVGQSVFECERACNKQQIHTTSETHRRCRPPNLVASSNHTVAGHPAPRNGGPGRRVPVWLLGSPRRPLCTGARGLPGPSAVPTARPPPTWLGAVTSGGRCAGIRGPEGVVPPRRGSGGPEDSPKEGIHREEAQGDGPMDTESLMAVGRGGSIKLGTEKGQHTGSGFWGGAGLGWAGPRSMGGRCAGPSGGGGGLLKQCWWRSEVKGPVGVYPGTSEQVCRSWGQTRRKGGWSTTWRPGLCP